MQHFLSSIYAPAPVYLNEPLRLQNRLNQDPFTARWERFSPGDIGATVASFDPRGSFVAIGTSTGQVSLGLGR